ncbi:MAG: L-rhamnose mutarotase [Eubacteriales bacterium]
MKRYGQLIGIAPENLEEYVYNHQNPWPEVNAMIKACHIENYSIYHMNGLLFSYYEYTGDDYDADMAKMAEDPMTQKWWDLMMPLQKPLEGRKEGEWWANMEEVYHLD